MNSRKHLKIILKTSRLRPLKGLVLFFLLAEIFINLLNQSALTQAASSQVSLAQTPVVSAGRGQRVGQTDRNRQISLAVGLKVTGEAALDQFIASQYDPNSPDYKHFLTPQQFTERFVNQSDRAEIIKYLQSKGLRTIDSGLGTLINTSGTVTQVEDAFGVVLSDYRDNQTGQVFFSNDVGPVLPASVQSRVKGVVGLSNQTQYKPRFQRLPSQPTALSPRSNGTPSSGCPAAQTVATNNNSFVPNQLKTAYNFDPFYSQGISGTGQTVAVYELADYLDSNISTYQTCFGTSVPVKRVPVDGGVAGIYYGQGEVELDIEIIAGMAPGLKQILVYEAPLTNAGYIDEFQQIANDNLAQVVSISWGDCESQTPTSTLDTENAIFRQMAAQGQSVFAASGDTGSELCLPNTALDVSDILDTPYVTGVGGTRLNLNADNTINNEITWNDSGASSGGISAYFARPAWQTGPGTNNSYSNGKRMMPDVSAAGSPNTGYVVFTGINGGSGSWRPIGGTSAGAPLWAAAAALTNNYLSKFGLPGLGFANPTLYRIFNSPVAGSVYHDITVGDNCYQGPTCGTPNTGSSIYPSTTGYDMATGIGTLNAYNFARYTLGCPTSATMVHTAADDGSPNTLRSALNTANNATPNGCKLVDLTDPAIGPSIKLQGSGLTVRAGVTLLGPVCTATGPGLTISGFSIIRGVPTTIDDDGLILNGATVAGLNISRFGKRQIVANGLSNHLGCVKASKT